MEKELRERLNREHAERMRALNAKYGVAWTEADVADMPGDWTVETLREKVQAHPDNLALNFVPLQWWDILALSMMSFQRTSGLSLSEGVSMQKQACLDMLFPESE